MSDKLDDMYREIIMEHYRYPRSSKEIKKANVKNQGKNPACGDELNLAIEIDNGIVRDISVGCKGCAISVASGSILTEVVKGKSVADVKKIALAVKSILKGERLDESIDLESDDLEALRGVKNFPVRIKCALLSWTTLVNSIESWEKDSPTKTVSTE